MDLNKHLSFFNPDELKREKIHILGCGAVGSYVALQLAKLGVENITLWDDDIVENHNITNQVFDIHDVGKLKTDALEKHLLDQNPLTKIIKKKRYIDQPLTGILFLCIDSAETKYKIAHNNKDNALVKLVIDGRIGLQNAEVHCINWLDESNKEKYLDLINFKDDEVTVETSPCGTTLSVSPSVLICISYMVSCVINYAKGIKNPTRILIDAFNFITVKF